MKHLGRLNAAIALRDLFLLENQIPFRVLKLLNNLRYGAAKEKKLITRYINMILFGEYHWKIRLPKENRAEPLHLLEAFHRLFVSNCVELKKTGIDLEVGVDKTDTRENQGASCLLKFLSRKHIGVAKETNAKRHIKKKYVHSFRSVTDLKAKGIYFGPSSTQSLKDVEFKSKFFYAKLELPRWPVYIYTKVFFMNMIAYELSPNDPSKGQVTSYINFMKSLIERPEDVKELRERKILYNMLGSDEEVLKVYKDIDIYGANNPKIFCDVKDKIQAHYNSKKTWMAKLIHTHFLSPWTIIAFLAAIILLTIASAQLYDSVHRKSK